VICGLNTDISSSNACTVRVAIERESLSACDSSGILCRAKRVLGGVVLNHEPCSSRGSETLWLSTPIPECAMENNKISVLGRSEESWRERSG